MTDYISREAAIAYIREQAEESQKAFEELGGEIGIYADAYNDLAEEFYGIPAADVEPVRYSYWESYETSQYMGTYEGGEPKWRPGKFYVCHNRFCRRKTVVKSSYCPNCGAKMDLEVDHDN